MWDKIGANIEERTGTPKDEAFKQSVLARAALKRAQVARNLISGIEILGLADYRFVGARGSCQCGEFSGQRESQADYRAVYPC